MKKTLIILILLSSNFIFSQTDKYCVTYKIDKYTEEEIQKNKEKRINDLFKKINQIQKKMEFELTFNIENGFFKRKTMMIPEGKEFLYAFASDGLLSDDLYYRDNKNKYISKNFQGEQFKIIYPYQQYDWKITEETKVIKGYTCFKAITKWEEYDYGRDITLKFKPFVWFTYDLKFPYGPKGLDGLPGLVLEGSFNGVIYYKASKIEKRDNIVFPKIKYSEEIKFKDYLKLLGQNRKKRKK